MSPRIRAPPNRRDPSGGDLGANQTRGDDNRASPLMAVITHHSSHKLRFESFQARGYTLERYSSQASRRFPSIGLIEEHADGVHRVMAS